MINNSHMVMKKIQQYFIVLVLLFAALPAGAESIDPNKQDSVAGQIDPIRIVIDAVITKVKPALVRIFVVNVKYENGREVKYEAAGSGVIITKEGHVITNHHVAGNARQIVCTLSDNTEVNAVLVSTDPLSDISVIKLQNRDNKEFPVAEFGDSSGLKVGDRVFAMGSPYALSQSVTMGIVSNTELILTKFHWPFDKFTLEGENVGSIVKWIGHDAPIYGGNSGGPLVNLKGEIIGVNEISLGIGGAIPGNLAKDVADQLMKFGKVKRSWFGIDIQPLLKKSRLTKGALVSGTIKGSPSEKAGFLPGDILLKMDGKEVNIRFPEEVPVYNQTIMNIPVGKKVNAVVMRGDKEVTLHITSEEREYLRSKTVEMKRWGITVRNLSFMAASYMKRDNRDGVLVTSIRKGGPAWEADLRLNNKDVIVKVNETPIENVGDLRDLTNEKTKDTKGPLPVVVTFERGKEQYLTVIDLELKKDTVSRGYEVRKPWLPVSMQVLTKETSQFLGLDVQTGMRITQVYSSGSAQRAGLRTGDLIVKLDGEDIPVSSSEDYEVFTAMIRQYKIGSIVELAVLRDGKIMNIKVELEQSPKLSGEMKRYTDNNFEFTVRDMAFLDHVNEGNIEDQTGILVESVNNGGWASLAKLAVGDEIITVDGQPVSDVDSIEEMMNDISDTKPDSIIFQVRRDIHNIFIELEPGWSGSDRDFQ